MIPQEKISEAVRVLAEAADPVRIILFGSYACGTPAPDSDLDFLVVEKQVRSRRAEIVRLRRLISPLRIPADVLVTTEDVFNEWCDTPGTVLHEAATRGKVVYEQGS